MPLRPRPPAPNVEGLARWARKSPRSAPGVPQSSTSRRVYPVGRLLTHFAARSGFPSALARKDILRSSPPEARRIRFSDVRSPLSPGRRPSLGAKLFPSLFLLTLDGFAGLNGRCSTGLGRSPPLPERSPARRGAPRDSGSLGRAFVVRRALAARLLRASLDGKRVSSPTSVACVSVALSVARVPA